MVWIWLAFFLSGIAGISYELIWVRYIGWFVGASTPAISATVAIFLGGLALGSVIGGRYFNRMRYPLRAYAALEIAIGIMAACVPFLFGLTETFLARFQHDGGGILTPLTASAVVLLLPTTLLGATFPAMAAAVRHLANRVYATGFFYGFNTLGGVIGCVLIPFVFLPRLGHGNTNWAMVSINVTVAALVLWADRRFRRRSEQGGFSCADSLSPSGGYSAVSPSPDQKGQAGVARETDSVTTQAQGSHFPFNLACVLAVASGFFAIGIEILWTRALALSFPATVYVFAVVLGAYLTGIGLGSVGVSFLSRRRPLKRALLWLYGLVALGTLLTLSLFPSITRAVFHLAQAGVLTSWEGYIGVAAAATFVVMLPATFAMGAALPLLIGLTTQRQQESRIAGQLYALNLLGGVVGSLSATFWLMPWAGLSRAIVLFALGYLALTMLLAYHLRLLWPMRAVTLALFLLVGFGAMTGRYPVINPQKAPKGQQLLFHQDAPSGTISILQESPGIRSLMINKFYGHNRTSPPAVAMHYRLAHLSLLLHPAPNRALLIGFATGNTLAAMAEHPLMQLDCVELHPLLFQLAPYFKHVNHGVWQDPKVHLIAGDGRRYLLGPGAQYDVIVGDLYFPRSLGVGALYSLEHFGAARRRLAPGGLFVAWLPLWQLTAREVGSIVHTFLQVFPAAEGWLVDPERPVLGLVGGKSPLRPPPQLESRLRAMLAASLLKTYGSSSTFEESVLVQRALLTEHLKRWGELSPINSLEYPLIEYSVPRSTMQYAFRRTSQASENLLFIQQLQGGGV